MEQRSYIGAAAAVLLMLVLIIPNAAALGGDEAWYNIHCNVDGASVYFDNEYKGQTAGGVLSVAVYTTGKPYSTVKVEKSGYYPATSSLPPTPAAGTSRDVYVTLNQIPSPTTPSTGTLNIRTSPSGARIHVNDVYQGVSPITLDYLQAGKTYLIEAEMNGYESVTQSVYLNPGETRDVLLTLSSPGSVSVTSYPSDAYVSVNGVAKGRTPCVITGLSSGTHEIEVTLNGYYNWKKSVDVIEGTQISVYAELQPISSVNQILVTSTPWGAKIYLDGVYLGETLNGAAFPIQDVSNGQHTLKLTLAGYADYVTPVTMNGATISINADMTQSSANAGTIALSSSPEGSMVYLDNGYTGQITPCNLYNVAAGEHTVMLRLSGYQDTYSRVVVTPGQVSTLTMSMAPGSSPTPGPSKSPGFGAIAALLALAGTMAVLAIFNRK